MLAAPGFRSRAAVARSAAAQHVEEADRRETPGPPRTHRSPDARYRSADIDRLSSEDAQPSQSETEVWEKVSQVLTEARVILDDLQAYRGAGEEIRQSSVEGVQEKAWSAVVPLVAKLKTFYEFSQKLVFSVSLMSSPALARLPLSIWEQKQALARQFAQIMHFTLRFDELKMTNPAIQNDFSYYRRTISRMRINNLSVKNELANRMSLFYASATPMLKTLSDARRSSSQ
ncbi:hypothetical protein INR49_022633, partial [Caranx melampygus]